jgi:hypothetical protein
MTTYKTTVTVSANASQPVSAQEFNTTGQTVMIFDVKNNGGYKAFLNNATFTIAYTQGTGSATTQGNRSFYLYDAADSSTVIASTTIATSTTISGLSFTPIFFGDNAGGFEIAPNQTKTFFLAADLSDCAGTSGGNAGSTIKFSISDGTKVNWDDGVAASVQSASTKNTPVSGTVVTF